MPKLAPLKASEIVRKLKALGYDGPIPGGRHLHMVNYATKQVIPIPAHGNKDVGIGLLRKIIREANVTVEEWQKL
jgi:predicted RNA binding protein YcfA (HicA-like mRNA interferase family)